MADDEPDPDAAIAFGYAEGEREAIDVISDFVPERDDYAGKGQLDERHPHLITRLEMLPALYPEVFDGELEEVPDRWADQYEKRLTSVGGLARHQITQILQSLSGSGGGGSSSGQAPVLEKLLTPADDD